jgi:8-oxo-dGTP diphosphatase
VQTIEELLEAAELIPAVVSFHIKNNKVLLIHRKTELGFGKYSGAGGKIGDTPETANEGKEEAFVREDFEELEVTPVRYKEVGRVRIIWPNKPKYNMDITVYLVTEWIGTPTETAAGVPCWFDIDSLPVHEMWEDNLDWIPQILAGKKIDVVCVYDKHDHLVQVQYN